MCRVGLLAAAIVSGSGAEPCWGAETPSPNRRAEVAPLPSEDLSAAVRLETDRALEDLLKRAQAAIERQDASTAVSLLQEVLDAGPDRLVMVGDSCRSATAEANRILAQLPRDALTLYERLAGAAAEAAVAQARETDDPILLQRLAIRYRHTSVGSQLWRDLAQAAFDRGQFEQAAAAFSALIADSPDPEALAAREPQLVLAWCGALLQLGDREAVRSVAARFSSALERTRFPGRDGTAADAIEMLLQRASEEAVPGTGIPDDPARWLFSAVAPAVWEVTLLDESYHAALDDSLRELEDASVAPFLQWRPLVIEAGIVCRTWDSVRLLDARTGETRWRYELPNLLAATAQPPTLAERVMGPALRHVMGDGAYGSLSSDGRHVYCVVAAPSPNSDPLPGNALLALQVEDGEPAWILGSLGNESSDDQQRSDADAADPVLFRGPPTPWGAQLLALVEKPGTLSLMAYDAATGRKLYELPLCTTEIALGRDDRRLAQACPIVVSNGLAFCPTGGGALVAVDLRLRAVRWAFRYPRERMRPVDRDAPLVPTRRTQVLWADGWREIGLSTDGERVILASGESSHLFALDARTGELVWSAPREDGVYLAGSQDGVAVVVGRDEVRAHRVEDGGIAWHAAVGTIAGRGVLNAGHVIVPLRAGAVAAIRLRDGSVARTWSVASEALPVEADFRPAPTQPVSLAWTLQGPVVQTPSGIHQPTPLVDSRRDAASDPLAAAALAVERGAFGEAVGLLETALQASPPDQTAEIRTRLIDAALRWIEAEPQRCDEIARRVAGEAAGDRERIAIEWQRFLTADLAAEERIARARKLFDLECERFYVLADSGDVRVRLDRAIQGRLLQERATNSEGESSSWDVQLASAFADVSGGAVTARLADFWDHFPLGQQARLSIPLQWSSAAELLRAQVRLLHQSRIADPPLAAAALARLAELYTLHSDPQDAAHAYRILEERFPETELPDGGSVAAMLESARQNPAVAAWLEPVDPWPVVQPEITSRPFHEGDIYFLPVGLRGDVGGSFARLNVAVHRTGTQSGQPVRFSGAGLRRPWALMLPTRDNPLHSSQSHPDLRRAWGFGQLLVLQVGAQVYGIAPFNAAGEPEATIVWPPSGHPITTTSELAAQPVMNLNASAEVRIAVFDESENRAAEFGHRIGCVGPVRGGYFCVQRQGTITAYDTATGVELWSRARLSPGVRACGDDRSVILHDVPRGRITVLRAVDGTQVDEFPVPFDADRFLTTFGRLVLLESKPSPADSGSDYVVSAMDLVSRETVWEHAFAAESVCFPVDERWCGVLEPEGRLHFLRVESGETVAVHQVDVPRPLVHVRSIVDEQRVMVVISGPRQDDGLEAATRGGGIHANESHRRIIANGPWYTFDRHSGDLFSRGWLDNVSLRLDQPVDVPILVCNELRYPPERIGQGSPVGRVRCFDRRTGEQLLDELVPPVHTFFLVERDVDEGWVELRLPARVVRFDYSGSGQAPGSAPAAP